MEKRQYMSTFHRDKSFGDIEEQEDGFYYYDYEIEEYIGPFNTFDEAWTDRAWTEDYTNES